MRRGMAVSASGPSASDGADDPSEAEAEALPVEEEVEEEEEARTAWRCAFQQALTRAARRPQEPQLVYARVAGEAAQLLTADVATAVGLCGRLVAVGTRRGTVVLYDAQGKAVRAAAAGAAARVACSRANARCAGVPLAAPSRRGQRRQLRRHRRVRGHRLRRRHCGGAAPHLSVAGARAAHVRSRLAATQVASTSGEEHSVYEYHKAVKARARAAPQP